MPVSVHTIDDLDNWKVVEKSHVSNEFLPISIESVRFAKSRHARQRLVFQSTVCAGVERLAFETYNGSLLS